MINYSLPNRRTCGTHMEHRRLLNEEPLYADACSKLENFTRSYIVDYGRLARRRITRIPVVVHVVWNTENQNIDDDQINSQIDVLNQDFRMTNPEIANVPEIWQSLVADARIEFFLATIDPNGNPTTGITRTQTTVARFSMNNNPVKSTTTGGIDPWPADRYLNIWVCQLGDDLLGYAQFPGGPQQTDGIVILHTAFGTNGTATAPFNLGRTATHEVGHWLNLWHIWGDDGMGCSGTDLVADTPNAAGPNYGCPSFPNVSCNNGPNGDMFMNFMDYTDDECMSMFTAEQVARMHATLDGVRTLIGAPPPVYAENHNGNGIGGYDLKSPADRAFAFDYDGSGKLDHIVLYRPGAGAIWILKNSNGTFTPVYAESHNGNGIGGYDLKSPADRAFAFDYDGSGKLDHIVLYRPGAGAIWILKNSNGTFTPVYAESHNGNGIGGYDLKSPADRVFAFDYDGSGKLDHIVLYRPGAGAIWILKNSNGTFTPVYAESHNGNGIGGYDLKSPADRVFPLDHNSSGKLDHIVLYRPGAGAIWILKNSNGTFTPVYAESHNGNGIGGYDLKSPADRVFPLDHNSSGKLDHIVLYRPGAGAIWILKNSNGTFTPVYAESHNGNGIGGYDLKSPADRAFAFDYDGSGKLDHIVLYRPGAGAIWII